MAVIDRKPFDQILQLQVTMTLTVDLKNIRGLLRVMTNHHNKFGVSRPYPSPVIDWKPFDPISQLKVTVTLTFDLVT